MCLRQLLQCDLMRYLERAWEVDRVAVGGK